MGGHLENHFKRHRQCCVTRSRAVSGNMLDTGRDHADGIAEWLFASPRGRVGTLEIGDLTEDEIGRVKANAARVTVVNFDGESSGYGHDYFRTNPAVSSDIVLKIRYGLKPGEAGRPLEHIGLNFWRVPDAYPANSKIE